MISSSASRRPFMKSVHHLTEDHDAFPLIAGDPIKRPSEASKFYAPSTIAKKFNRSDMFVSTYLKPGEASSAVDFVYLLDEFNAYTHDLNAAIELNSLRPSGQRVDHRDGLAAFMAFVSIYVQTAEGEPPGDVAGLQKPQVAKTISALWGQAETVIAASCAIPDFGTHDQTFIRQSCEEKPQSAMQKLLGRPPVCPVDCLQSTAKSAFRH